MGMMSEERVMKAKRPQVGGGLLGGQLFHAPVAYAHGFGVLEVGDGHRPRAALAAEDPAAIAARRSSEIG